MNLPQSHQLATDKDRDALVTRVQRAMVDGYVRFDELNERFAAIYAAETLGELELIRAELPGPPDPPPAPMHPATPTSYSVFGNVKVGGWISVNGDIFHGSVFGNVFVDLSSARLPGCTISARTFFGNVTVILPDGVTVSRKSTTVFGNKTEVLSPPIAGMSQVHVSATSIFGNVEIYSLSKVPQGWLRKLWKALRGS